MSGKPVSAKSAEALRDDVEDLLAAAMASATRAFLADVTDAALAGLASSPEILRASALPHGETPPLGALAGRWAAEVDSRVLGAVGIAFDRVWARYARRGLVLDSPAERAMSAFVASVRDRLVRGNHFGVTVYEDSFEAIRSTLALSVADGWPRQKLAQRIAKELAWETDGEYWRGVKADADYQIDQILDAIGPPNTPAREYARHNDPRVRALREQRNRAIKHLDAEQSIWQTRSMLIARTESTGIANFGALEALSAEGSTRKMWVSTSDARTRPSHLEAGDTVAGLAEPFTVGGYSLQFPGDPAGPVAEVANCRCAMVDPDNL